MNSPTPPRRFPYLLDAEEALAYAQKNSALSEAELAYVIGLCSREGFTNRRLRVAFNIDKVYTLTHYARVGKTYTEGQLALWHNNPCRITLGHMRALCRLDESARERMLRKLLAHPMSVAQCEQLARGDAQATTTDIKRYESLMSDSIGHPVSIKFNAAANKGKLSLDFFNLDELDKFAELLGFNPKDYF